MVEKKQIVIQIIALEMLAVLPIEKPPDKRKHNPIFMSRLDKFKLDHSGFSTPPRKCWN